MNKILLAVDGSESSGRALQFLIAQIQAGAASEVHLINVQSWPMSYYDAMTALSAEELQKTLMAMGQEVLAPVFAQLQHVNIAAHKHVHVGEIASTIVEQARQLGCQQIVMGSRGMGALKGLFIGSVATRVVSLTDLPVTLIK